MKNKKNKIVIASGKGGVGKSMLVSALATLFSKNQKVVAVDCDADAPNLVIWLGGIEKLAPHRARSGAGWDKVIPVVTSAKPEFDLDKCNGCGLCAKNCRFSALRLTLSAQGKLPKPKLNPFLCEGCGACEVICPQKAIQLKPVQNGEIKIKKIREIGGKFVKIREMMLVSGQLYPGETGSGKVVAEIKKEADKFDHNLMIIDSAPGTGCPVIASLQDANFSVLITEPTPSGFTDLKRVLKVVNHFKIPWGLVINKWDIDPKLSDQIKKWARKKFLGRISYDKKIFKAIANLTPILETNLKAKVEIKNIFKKINKLCPDH